MSSAAPRLDPNDDERAPADPVVAWINAHGDEVRRHKGRHVAIDPARGIVASGTYEEVTRSLEAAGISPMSDVTIYPVR